MSVFFQIAYFVIGIVQFLAVWDGAKYLLDVDSMVGKVFTFFLSFFVTYLPLIGSAIGVYGAVNVWDWSLTKSVILFFWYVPVFVAFLIYGAIADRS